MVIKQSLLCGPVFCRFAKHTGKLQCKIWMVTSFIPKSVFINSGYNSVLCTMSLFCASQPLLVSCDTDTVKSLFIWLIIWLIAGNLHNCTLHISLNIFKYFETFLAVCVWLLSVPLCCERWSSEQSFTHFNLKLFLSIWKHCSSLNFALFLSSGTSRVHWELGAWLWATSVTLWSWAMAASCQMLLAQGLLQRMTETSRSNSSHPRKHQEQNQVQMAACNLMVQSNHPFCL